MTGLVSSRHASSVIAEAKAEVWQAICSSLSPKSNSKFVYFLLRSVAGSFCSSSSSSPNIPNCSSTRESASVFVDFLRSCFSVSQTKATSPRSAESRALRSLISLFAHPSPSLNFSKLPRTSVRPLPLV